MKSFKRAQYFGIFLLCLGFILYFAPTVSAATTLLPPCVESGNCTLCDIIQTVINAGKILLGVIGSIVLLMFVIGGFYFLVSGGEDAKIKKGREIIYNAVIGLIIVLSAYLIVTVVISVVTNQKFNLEANLTCTPVDFAPKPPDNAANLTDAIPPAAAPGTQSKPGDECNANGQCTTLGLFCNDQNKCQGKLDYGADCKGKTKLAADWADDKGILIGEITFALVTGVVGAGAIATADYVQVMSLSNEACMSGDCNIVNFTGFGKCEAPKEGQGTTEIGQPCTRSNVCTAGTYCQIDSAGATSGKCVKKSIIGQPCISSWILDGNPNQICNYPSMAQCDRDYCVPRDGTGKDGQMCTSSAQCQSGSCACPGAATANTINTTPCNLGICTPKIPENNTTTYCGGWTVKSLTTFTDNSRCATDDCSMTGTNAGRCE